MAETELTYYELVVCLSLGKYDDVDCQVLHSGSNLDNLESYLLLVIDDQNHKAKDQATIFEKERNHCCGIPPKVEIPL